MSFILDALKKIERDKRLGQEGRGIEAFAASRRSYGGRRSWMAMGAIAVTSAAVTAAGVTLWLQQSDTASSAGSQPEVSSAAQLQRADEPEPAPDVPEPAAAAAPQPARPDEVETQNEPAAEAPRETAALEPPRAESEDTPAETAAPVRLVGRERALHDAVSVTRAAERDEPTANEPADTSLPENFPKLVLQGTSVIGTDAVAVISDQRVFEGDVIEGALVVRIREREVELEYDGRRFTLKL